MKALSLITLTLICVTTAAQARNISLEKARKAFEDSDLEKSISLYQEVSKKSPYWGTALEEMAWAHLRLNQTSEALAATKTLHSFPLNQLAFYESYVIQGLTELRTCRYQDVFKTIENFKIHKIERIRKLEDFADKKSSTQSLIHQIAQLRSLSSFKSQLPDLSELDLTLLNLLKSKKPDLNALASRLQLLAKQELSEIEMVVTQLKLIEVEAEQRVIRDAQNGFKTEQSGSFKKTNYNQLIFPADDNPWIDELGQFEVAMQACQKQRRKL